MTLRSLLFSIFALLLLASCNGKADGQNGDGTLENGGGGAPDSEIARLTEAIEESPNDASLYLERAALYDKKGDLEPAIRDAEKAATLDSNKAGNHLFLAGLYEKRPYIRGAIQAYERAAAMNPQDKNTFLKLGILYFQVKDRNNSFENLNKALEIDPQMAEAFFYRGYNYRELNTPDKAIREFERARELKPDHFDAYLQLGLLYAEKKDPRAGEYYTTALRLNPGNLRALYARGIYYQEADSAELAINDYERILELTPEFLSTNLNLGYIYLRRQEYDKAVEYFTQAIDNNPASREAYEYRSEAYKGLGKAELAEADTEKAKQLENQPAVE